MYIVEIKGKQYGFEKEGDKVKVDFIDQEAGSDYSDIKVLYHRKDSQVDVGTPYLNIKVNAKVDENSKDRKVKVIHYKPKSRIYSKQGHRQKYTHLKIDKIQG